MHVLNDNDPNDESLIGNEPQFILNSPYLNDEQLAKLIKTKPNSFSILSLNCQSIRAKIDHIKILMHKIRNLHCLFDLICVANSCAMCTNRTSLLV